MFERQSLKELSQREGFTREESRGEAEKTLQIWISRRESASQRELDFSKRLSLSKRFDWPGAWFL